MVNPELLPGRPNLVAPGRTCLLVLASSYPKRLRRPKPQPCHSATCSLPPLTSIITITVVA